MKYMKLAEDNKQIIAKRRISKTSEEFDNLSKLVKELCQTVSTLEQKVNEKKKEVAMLEVKMIGVTGKPLRNMRYTLGYKYTHYREYQDKLAEAKALLHITRIKVEEEKEKLKEASPKTQVNRRISDETLRALGKEVTFKYTLDNYGYMVTVISTPKRGDIIRRDVFARNMLEVEEIVRNEKNAAINGYYNLGQVDIILCALAQDYMSATYESRNALLHAPITKIYTKKEIAKRKPGEHVLWDAFNTELYYTVRSKPEDEPKTGILDDWYEHLV